MENQKIIGNKAIFRGLATAQLLGGRVGLLKYFPEKPKRN
jgi:hypothetical protein